MAKRPPPRPGSSDGSGRRPIKRPLSQAPEPATQRPGVPATVRPQSDMRPAGHSRPTPTAADSAATVPLRPVQVSTAPIAASVGLDKFAVGSELGRGGMGIVRAAEDRHLRRELAIKKLVDPSDRRAALVFIEEAQITGQLEHPNIVPVHELGVDAEGRPWLAMKRVQGITLRHVIRQWERDTREPHVPLSPERLGTIVDYVRKIGDAIGFAHSRGVIHRDLKPENVMVGEFGEVLVMDWGLAKPRTKADAARPTVVRSTRRETGGELTVDGEIFGTPSYMPPEQARGDIDRIDERADIFAIGGILYHLLTLQAPYVGAHVHEILLKAAQGQLVPPHQRSPEARIPRELSAIVMRAMHPEPRQRYQSVRAFMDDLAAWQAHLPTVAYRQNAVEALLKWMRRHPTMAMSAALSVVFAAVAGLLIAGFIAQAERAHAAEVSAAAADLTAEKAEQEKRFAAERAVAAEKLAGVEAQRREEIERVAREREELLQKMRAGDYAYVLEQLRAKVTGEKDAAFDGIVQAVERARAKFGADADAIAKLPRAEVRDFIAAYEAFFEAHAKHDVPVTAADYANFGLFLLAFENDVRRADAVLGEGLEQFPTDAGLYSARGAVRFAGKDFRAAIADYDAAERHGGSDVALWNNRATAKINLGDYRGALADLDRAIAAGATDAETFFNRGCAKQSVNDVAGALADFDRALAIDDKHSRALVNRGLMKQAVGDPRGAIADYDRAEAIDPANLKIHVNRGSAWQALGDHAKAIADFDTALARDEKLWNAWAGRAMSTQHSDAAATLHALQQAHKFCDHPPTRQQLAAAIRQFGGSVPE